MRLASQAIFPNSRKNFALAEAGDMRAAVRQYMWSGVYRAKNTAFANFSDRAGWHDATRVLSGLQSLNGCRPDKRSAIEQDHPNNSRSFVVLIIETLPLLRQHIRRLRQEGKRVALVPTGQPATAI